MAREEAGKLLPYNLAVDAIITGGLPQHGPCAQPPMVLGPLWAPLGHRVPHPPRVPSPPACVPMPWYPNLHPSHGGCRAPQETSIPLGSGLGCSSQCRVSDWNQRALRMKKPRAPFVNWSLKNKTKKKTKTKTKPTPNLHPAPRSRSHCCCHGVLAPSAWCGASCSVPSPGTAVCPFEVSLAARRALPCLFMLLFA